MLLQELQIVFTLLTCLSGTQAGKSSKIFTTLPECHWAAGGESWSFRTSDRI